MKIASCWSGHDCSFAVLGNGRPLIHFEWERHIREKEPYGDANDLLFKNYEAYEDIKHVALVTPTYRVMELHNESWKKMSALIDKNGGSRWLVGHHQAHAANAFFSSNFDDALIITLDGGGVELEGNETACTAWYGLNNQLKHITTFPMNEFNVGGLWTRCTRYIFKLQSGWPLGHQAGTVMSMAALGDPKKYRGDFWVMLTRDLVEASVKPITQPVGALMPGKDPIHPYLEKWAQIANRSEQERYDLAAGLQAATEEFLFDRLGYMLSHSSSSNLCLAGGVSLNSVFVGKIQEKFGNKIKAIHVTPTPHDGGLTIGAAQHTWHVSLGYPRVKWHDHMPPYMGIDYSYGDVAAALVARAGKIDWKHADDDDVIRALDDQKIVAVFSGRAESGKRALGNRSILADPRTYETKERVNEKVKHRQFFRPFAPSILREEVTNWFVRDAESPYMSVVLRFRNDKAHLVPAVVHFDGTARLQTVTENDNPWYYGMLKRWHNLTNVPMLLNTSFNDREPIADSPGHALDCFLGTNIDHVYFPEYGILVSRR